MSEDFGKRLKTCRLNRGWSRGALILRVRSAFGNNGVKLSERAVWAIENGRTKAPHDLTMAKLSKVLPELIGSD